MNELIDRQAALEKVRAMQTYKLFKNDDMLLVDKAEVQTELMMLPSVQPEVLACGNGELVAQPEPTDIDAKEAVYNLAEKIGIHQLFALTVELRGEPIQPEPHEGRFERKQDGVFCSVCHYGWEFITGVPAEVEREYHYCPNCGAHMRGEKDG